MIALVLDTIDQFSMYKSPRHFANYAGEDAATLYEEISSYLYLLLGGFHTPPQLENVIRLLLLFVSSC